jgi:hypothetical protein
LVIRENGFQLRLPSPRTNNSSLEDKAMQEKKQNFYDVNLGAIRMTVEQGFEIFITVKVVIIAINLGLGIASALRRGMTPSSYQESSRFEYRKDHKSDRKFKSA